MSQWLEIRPLIDEMVNRQFDAPEFKKLLAVPLTPGRIQLYRHHMTYYGANRRDCWAFVSGKAPLDVKRAIWTHEKDELIHDARMGRAHVTEEDLRERDESLLVPGAKAAFYAWLYCAREKPWLEGLFYSHILERRNNNAVVKGGGLSERWKRKQQADLGVKEAAKDFQTEVHAVADEEHSDLFEPLFTRYIDSKVAAEAALAATRDCLVIDRAFRGALADAIADAE
ncbi:MAG TPA: hypothetical protein VI231_06595 [Candidatus Binatia bacterium]|jgi:hypothetical protein